MKLKEIIQHLETIAPLAYQESYDNAGLIVGDAETELTGALICLDSIEDVIEEAIRKKCNLVIAHHPIIFNGLKKLNGKNYMERTVINAIKNNIAIYAIHTNLDNVHNGVNRKICQKLGLKNQRILSPKRGLLSKLVTYVPAKDADKLRTALFSAGAGNIGNYAECSFNIEGTGTFKAGDNANPYVGKIGEQHKEPEERIEVIFESHNEKSLLHALKSNHPYEEIAFDIYPLSNVYKQVGSGMTGETESEIPVKDFLKHIKSALQADCIRHTKLVHDKIKKVAVCGGAGSFLLPDAIREGAQIFITADFKYHQFFDADGKIIIADTGHYETEHFTKELIIDLLKKKFPTFAVHLSELNTNPIYYF